MPRLRSRSRTPRLRSGAVALFVLLAFAATLGLLADGGMPAYLAAAPAFQQGEGPSDCVISGTKRAAPQQVLFGEPISITMAVEAACPSGADLAAAVLVDPLGAKVELVPDSLTPPATTLGPAGRRPEWRFSVVPAGGITVTLVVTPTAPGFVTTNAGATWTITDTDGLTATLRLPNPRVLVLGGPGQAATATSVPTATATTDPATATFTALPATGTATIAPSATATNPPASATTTPTPTPADGGGGTGQPPATGTPTPAAPGASDTPTPDPAAGTGTPTPASPGGTDTPTPLGPSATPDAADRTPTPESTPAPPTGSPEPIYLPYLDRASPGANPGGRAGLRLDTVLLFERHASTTGDPLGTRRALRQLAQGLIFAPDQAPRRIGLISFGGVAVSCPPTDDIDAFEDCAERALAAGPAVGGDLAAGLRDARVMLSDSTAERSPQPASAVVAIAVKERPAGCDASLAELDRMRSAGTRLITLCPGDGCERTCLRDVASSRADYLVMQSFAWLLPTLDGVLQRLLPMGAPW